MSDSHAFWNIGFSIAANAMVMQSKNQLRAQIMSQVEKAVDEGLIAAGKDLHCSVDIPGNPEKVHIPVQPLYLGHDISWGIDYTTITAQLGFMKPPAAHLSKKALKQAMSVPAPAKKKGPGPAAAHEGASVKPVKHLGKLPTFYDYNALGSAYSMDPAEKLQAADSLSFKAQQYQGLYNNVHDLQNIHIHQGNSPIDVEGWHSKPYLDPYKLPKRLQSERGTLSLSDADIEALAKMVDDNPDEGHEIPRGQKLLLEVIRLVRDLTPLESELLSRDARRNVAGLQKQLLDNYGGWIDAKMAGNKW